MFLKLFGFPNNSLDISYKKTRKQENKKTRKQENKKTRKQENKKTRKQEKMKFNVCNMSKQIQEKSCGSFIA
jgi:hypothetical protein